MTAAATNTPAEISHQRMRRLRRTADRSAGLALDVELGFALVLALVDVSFGGDLVAGVIGDSRARLK
jgi:hypothetical protein